MAQTFPPIGPFRLGGFAVDPARNLIGDRTVEPKVMEVLCFLAAHPGEVVTRQAIIDAVWGVAYGGDESLTRAVSLLRKALAPPDKAEIIQTIPKRGYSLKAVPEAVAADPQPTAPTLGRRWWPWVAGCAALLIAACIGLVFALRPHPPASAIAGIVVLVKPFAAGTPASGSDVVADSLTASLARFDQITVRRDVASAPPDIRTAYVYTVTGTLSRTGSGNRVDVQLHAYPSGDILWSGSAGYGDDTAPAVSTLTAELEPAILQAAKTAVQNKPTESLSPWELVMLGTWIPGADREWQGPPDENSYWVWERAIARDPDFALAHASLAQVMANFALFDPPSDTQAHADRAMRSAERALQLAPYDAGVLYQVALYERYAGRRDQAAALFRRVLDIEPDNLMARIELDYVTGQCSSDSAASITRLESLDKTLPPNSPARWVVLSHIADMSLARGDYAEARAYAARSRLIVRQVWSSVTLAAADAELGNAQEAAAVGLEHQGQWPSLDYTRFADGTLSRWCMGGDTSQAGDAFLKLGQVVTANR